MHRLTVCIFALLLPVLAQGTIQGERPEEALPVAIVINPYTGDRSSPEKVEGPSLLANSGIEAKLKQLGIDPKLTKPVALTPEEEKEYGQWNRFGMANRHLGAAVSREVGRGAVAVGILANCSSLAGMLAGLQHSDPDRGPLKVGLVFIDAHGDFNTPETTLSGMLGGMPVAVAAGHCLTRMRLQSGLDPPLPEEHIVLACVRDTDPLEQERIQHSSIQQISVNDIRNLSNNIGFQMKRLSKLTDLIYIHVDMDVLDPKEVTGHPLTVPGGPTSKELAGALKMMFEYEKAAALGIASYPFRNDPDSLSMKAAYNLILGAAMGKLSH